MKSIHIYLIFFLLVCSISSFAQYKKYEVKVVLDSIKNVKGTLQKVSGEGIAVEDFRGNYYIFKAKNIVKIKVRYKGLTVVEGLGTGAAIGAAAGVAIFFTGDGVDSSFDKFGDKLAGTAFLAGVGAIGGTLGGLLGEALNTKIILSLYGDTQKFKKEYHKLEKYSKAYDLEKPAITKN
ncbi:hypothetical protein WG904_15340 [Pedobacter sp. Du54]|uniref:hypothetical protein n=1 Tax=Pedobacter anseongensis TaxID=3133439 RepID=UPI003099ADE4